MYPIKKIKNKINYTVSAPLHQKKVSQCVTQRKCTVSWPRGVF